MRRALVLGSGGLTGIAWEAGVLQGLTDAGVATSEWDLVVGSSAGAYVGARLLVEASPEPLFSAQLAIDVDAEEAALAAATGKLPLLLIRSARRPGLAWGARAGVLPLALRALTVNAVRHGPREFATLGIILRSRRAGGQGGADTEILHALGRLAGARRSGEPQWIAYWERALGPVTAWPATRLAVVAIDIADGSRRVVDQIDNVLLARAVAASSAVAGLLSPITLAGHRYMDGGSGSQTNADLATGHDQVLVVAPADRGALAGEVTSLRSAGAEVAVIQPSTQAATTLGDELARLDPARSPAAAEAGREDGRAAAPLVAP